MDKSSKQEFGVERAHTPTQRDWGSLLARVAVGLAGVLGAALLAPPALAQMSFYTAVDLALRNSAAVRLAASDVQRASVGVSESKDVYVPNLIFGSSLGYSYGFPVGQPSIFTLNSQSLVFSFSQKDYIRSARSGLKASELALKDTRQQVVLDAALDYIQLDTLTRQLKALDEQNAAAERLATIEQERVDAGLEGRTELLRARLTGAQVRLKRLHMQDDAAMLREKLAHLTGMPAPTFVTSTDSIPAPPGFATGEGLDLSGAGNAGVEAAYASAKSRQYIAYGDRRQNFRPQIAFGAQYSRFASFNNYDTYYKNFQPDNLDIGIIITLPFFDAARRDKGRESAADATHSTAQADQLRDQTSEQAMQLRKSFGEVEAQQEVAQIQSELADSELQTVLAQLESGSGSATGPQLTPKDEQQARIQERQRYQELLDINFELTRAQLGLLRAVGAIEDWALKAPHP